MNECTSSSIFYFPSELLRLAVASPVNVRTSHCLLYVRVSLSVIFCSETLLSCLWFTPCHGSLLLSSIVYAECQGSSVKCPLAARGADGPGTRYWTWRSRKIPSTQREHPFDIFINPLPTFGALHAGSLSSVATTSPTYIAARQGRGHGFPETL